MQENKTMHSSKKYTYSARPNSCNIGMFRVPPVPYLLYQKVREQFVN